MTPELIGINIYWSSNRYRKCLQDDGDELEVPWYLYGDKTCLRDSRDPERRIKRGSRFILLVHRIPKELESWSEECRRVIAAVRDAEAQVVLVIVLRAEPCAGLEEDDVPAWETNAKAKLDAEVLILRAKRSEKGVCQRIRDIQEALVTWESGAALPAWVLNPVPVGDMVVARALIEEAFKEGLITAVEKEALSSDLDGGTTGGGRGAVKKKREARERRTQASGLIES